MKKRITLKELAKILNVSASTVSKALNDSPGISKKTRERVKKVAEDNHYVPNETARNLKIRQTKTIGVIIPTILKHFFAKALNGIEKKASELGYGIIICISNESIDKEKEGIKTLINGCVDGLILSLSRETQASGKIEHIKEISKYRIPFVLFDRVIDSIECDKISINDAFQAEQATAELYYSGCRNIAYFSGISDTSVDKERKAGYIDAVKRFNLKKRIVQFEHQNYSHEEMKKIILDEKIDGIIAAEELSAVLTMKTILKCNLKVPDDISLIGFTNGLMTENFIPAISVVDQLEEEQGQLALETLVDRIEGNLPNEKLDYKLETNIIHRDSTRPVKSAI